MVRNIEGNQEAGKTKSFLLNEIIAGNENANTDQISAQDQEKTATLANTKGEIAISIGSRKDVSKSNMYYETINPVPSFWVQFNFSGGNRIPDGGPPLYYEPSRNYFVRVVFSIVLFMLILTSGFVMFVYMTDLRGMFLRYGFIPLIIGMGGMLGLNYAMMCSGCTRVPPCNFVCLFLAVCFMSLIAAYITARYRTQVVLLALMATTVTVIVCLGLACTNFDFTKYLLFVIVIATAFAAIAMIVSITMLLTNTRFKPVTLVILVIGTLINVVVLVIELQMILGGRTVELSEEDYALGAFMLYTSIVDIFLKLVQILGILDSD